jgi:spore coat polysaccharide biosynthesis protein SpsF (cytidylyltransferase family)
MKDVENSKNIIAIIQARMGSSRLPGKTLMDVDGKPLLVRVIERARLARSLHNIVVATTIDKSDDKIADLFCSLNYKLFRGSIYDVLDRYYQAAKENRADLIVRLCADSPLIDPELIDEVVFAFLAAIPPVDYASNRLERTYPVGLDVEVFSFHALESAWKNAKSKYQREHVTPYMYEPGSQCKALSVISNEQNEQYRWTVDMTEDLELVKRIYRHFAGRIDFSWHEVIELMRNKPEYAKLNLHVRQKDFKEYDEKSPH